MLTEYADLDGSPIARYIYAGSQRIAMVDSLGSVYYYLNDHLGSASVLITSTGTVRDTYKYKPFGESKGGAINNGQSYRYTGKPLDEELDLDWYYYGARYYGPEIGRFLAVDPLNSKYPSWSPYVYTLNNPLKYVDPTGDSVVVAGDIVDIQSFTQISDDAMGGFYTTSVDASGNVSLTATGIKGTMTSGQQAFYDILSGAVNATGTVSLTIVSNDSRTLGGSYGTGKIDMADINAFGNGELASSAGMLGHEVSEQSNKQLNNMTYADAHPIALLDEGYITGTLRTDQTSIIPPGRGIRSKVFRGPAIRYLDIIIMNGDIVRVVEN